MGVGALGQSLATAPERVEVEFALAADSATTLRECSGSEETFRGQVVYMICVFIQQMMTYCKSANAELESRAEV